MALSKLQTISISRGDTKQIDVSVTSGTLEAGDKIVFSVRKSVENASPVLITKILTLDSLSFIISHNETLLNYGTYYYDLRLVGADNSVTTLCLPSNFEILGAVGNV
jgi:hypothetical protein